LELTGGDGKSNCTLREQLQIFFPVTSVRDLPCTFHRRRFLALIWDSKGVFQKHYESQWERVQLLLMPLKTPTPKVIANNMKWK